MKTVAIIGGGITGLTAAFRLKQRGYSVSLFEGSDRVGGVIQTVRYKGYLAEFGPNTILETSPKIGALIDDLGLRARMLYSNPTAEKRFIVKAGKPIAVPASPQGFLTGDFFSWKAKTHLLAEPFVRRGNANEEESLEQFVLRRLGREFLDYAINPFVAGVYAGDPAKLSVKHAFPKLHALEQQYGSLILGQIIGARKRKASGEVSKQTAKKFSFDLGLQVLIDALRNSLGDAVHLRSPVIGVQHRDNQWRITTEGGDETFDAVLFALPAHKLSQIEIANAPGAFKSFGQIKYPPISSVVLGFRRCDVVHPLDGFGVLVPEVEKMNILGVIFSSSLFPNRAPTDHVALTVYVGGSRNPDLVTSDRSSIRRLVLADLRKLLGLEGRPTYEHFNTIRHAIPQYEVGYGKYKEMMTNLELRIPGLHFAGHSRDGISLSDSLVSGDAAADKICRFLEQTNLKRHVQLA